MLWYLRDELNLTGTKFSCGVGICGCCTVLVNGKATRSCVTFLDTLNSKEIITIEGLSKNGDHPLQQAWLEEEVAQCGYCQPGQIMTAAGLLNENPHPSEEQIADALNDNLCRCGTYDRIVKAIKKVAEKGGGK